MGWIVGAVINVIGSICINLGTNITKLGHNKTAEALPLEPPAITKHPGLWLQFPGKKWFVFGMTIFATGNVLNFASFGFAAQSLLAALGVVQFLSNMVFARFLNGEHITRRVMFATALVVTGCILLVSFGNHESPIVTGHELLELYSKGPYIAYLVVMAGTVLCAFLLYRKGKREIGGLKVQRVIHGPWGRWLPVCYALFSGLLGTQSVLYGKTLSMLLRTTVNGDSQLGFWYTWLALALFIFFAAFWLTRYSKALRLFPVTIIMPILQIVWVLFSIVSGSLYYQEYKTLNALSGSMFAAGVVVMLVGIAFLTGGRRPGQELPPGEDLEEEEEEMAELHGSQDPTPTNGKLLGLGGSPPPLRGSLRHKYGTSSQQGEGASSTDAMPQGEAGGGGAAHARHASDDAGARLFAGESSSASTFWDRAEVDEEKVASAAGAAAAAAHQQGPARAAVSKKPGLRVVVETGAGEELPAAPGSGDKPSLLEANDINTNFRQFAWSLAGLDNINPLSPAFTSFSMPLVPAVEPTPRPGTGAGGFPLSARGARAHSPLPGQRGKHRLQRSRSAGELDKIMANLAVMEAGVGEGGQGPGGSSTPPRRGLPGPPRQTQSMMPVRGTPFDGPASPPPPGGAVATPASAVHHLGPSLAGSAPRLATLGSGGTRRSWSMMSERGTPAPPVPLSLDTSFTPSTAGGADPGDAPASTSSTKPPRINPLSPRAFLEPLSPSTEQAAKEDLSALLAAQKGKHD